MISAPRRRAGAPAGPGRGRGSPQTEETTSDIPTARLAADGRLQTARGGGGGKRRANNSPKKRISGESSGESTGKHRFRPPRDGLAAAGRLPRNGPATAAEAWIAASGAARSCAEVAAD